MPQLTIEGEVTNWFELTGNADCFEVGQPFPSNLAPNPLSTVIQTTQDWQVNVTLTQKGIFTNVPQPTVTWEGRLFLEKMGLGEFGFVAGMGEFSTPLQVSAGPLIPFTYPAASTRITIPAANSNPDSPQPGMYKAVVLIQAYNSGAPMPIVAHCDLGLINIYQPV